MVLSLESIYLLTLERSCSFESRSTETISQIVEKHFAKVEEKDLIKEKLSYISDKVQKYAQKMNLGKVDCIFL